VLNLVVPGPPAIGFTVTGSGFAPDAWVWITVEDLTDDSRPVNGPDAFQSAADGTFTRNDETTRLPCGHAFRAEAFVDNQVVATSEPVMPDCPTKPAPAGPADPAASAATRAVFADLLVAPARDTERLIIGQALRAWDDRGGRLAEPVTVLTDKGLPAPKLLEVDLTDLGAGGTEAHDLAIYSLLLDHAARGGLVGFSWHAGNPWTGHGVEDRTFVDLPQLFDPDHPPGPADDPRGGGAWKTQLDRIAGVLSRFNADDTVVFFRPLHESNGAWFWWGQQDPAEFAALWQGMFRYLTDTKGLHNLLWVYSANRNLDGTQEMNTTRYYPGDDYVDVVALDIYDDDLTDAAPFKPGYTPLRYLGKPFAITEYGADNAWDGHPAHDGAVHLPNDKVLRVIKERYPLTVLATAWYSADGDNWQISDKPNPAALLLDPWAITR
jgi:mannan endo-1,4-beta-mannosidase